MPRKRRIVVPGELHHVMARGIDGRDIFPADEDRKQFLAIFGSALQRMKCRCYAWVLMSNHYHVLLRPFDTELGILMRRINTAYAQYYNRKYHRRGYVFQDRYKSIATQEMFYFKELIRYIHLNPVRAGLVGSVKKLKDYQWCGHQDIIGASRFTWFYKQEVLRRFDRDTAKAVKNYMDYLESGVGGESFSSGISGIPHEGNQDREDKENPVEYEGRVWGDQDFVRIALRGESDRKNDQHMLKNKGVSLDTIARTVAKHFGVERALLDLSGRNNDRSQARDVIAYFARCRLGETLNNIAIYFGVTPSAVSYMINRGALIIGKRKLNSLI